MGEVGGDFFDFIKFRNDEIRGFFMSDVSGHGVSAALITSLIKAFLSDNSLLMRDPAHLLSVLNEKLQLQTSGIFVTAIYAVYNPETRELIWASAGHTPPILITSHNASPLKEEFRGLPLAVLTNKDLEESGKSYQQNSVILPEKFKLLFYTDGLTECEPVEEIANTLISHNFEDNGLNQTLAELSQYNSQQLIHQLYEALKQFHGSNDFNDDICLVCLDESKN
jgi:sigma-B regulation protein RsbU (phosphoserine phosphatase)